MKEQYETWNKEKQKLNEHKRKLLFKEGEIWWCSVGVNIGEEVYGKGTHFRRPVVILKKLAQNSCVVMPTSTKEKEGTWYFPITVNEKKRFVLMNQIRFISANRFSSRESVLPEEQFLALKKSAARLLGFS
jgi:mRNA-degrading endonuclease toxin of MazEF toxin-antitoxin module